MFLSPPLQNGNILITGASAGIGRAMAYQLAPVAKNLVLLARREDRLRKIQEDLQKSHPTTKIVISPCDLLNQNSIDQSLTKIKNEVGSIDVLINNAGRGDIGFFENSKWENIDAMLKLNIWSLAYLTHQLLPHMIRAKKGGILNVGSGFGLTFLPGFAGYVGTKYFVTGFTESLRTEVQGKGVVVSQVCPGPVKTEFLDVASGKSGGSKNSSRNLAQSAEVCARRAIRGFRKNRAVIFTSPLIQIAVSLDRFLPVRWFSRWVYIQYAQFTRRKEEKEKSHSPLS